MIEITPSLTAAQKGVRHLQIQIISTPVHFDRAKAIPAAHYVAGKMKLGSIITIPLNG
ncbi:MAG TPA: hypothetical protein VMS43_12990 [Allosphingosinicella sp.]|nr:hypothetical protein [Allosphingosinicella sp.]